MKVTIRMSISNEQNSALRNKLAGILTGQGFVLQNNTASYENSSIQPQALSVMLQNYWSTAEAHSGPGVVDHFWMVAQ